MTEKSPVGDSKSNGLVERANREVEGQVRTMASALESKLGRKIASGSSVMPWLILHAGTLLRQFKSAKMGKLRINVWEGEDPRGNFWSLEKLCTLC